jgi:hypothetical protein
MYETTIEIALHDAAATFDCIAGLPYRLKKEVIIGEEVAKYAVPRFTMPKAIYVDCHFLDENFQSMQCAYESPVNPDDFEEPMVDHYLN